MTALVIVPSPRVDLAPSVRQRQKLMGVQAFVAAPAIEGLHEGVVGRFAKPREVKRYAVFMSPAIQRFGDKLRAIAHWEAALFRQHLP